MGRLLNIVNQLHRRTARDYVGRMADEKVHCSEVARRFDRDYWDGDRRYGYGGYKYDGRWSVVATATGRHLLAAARRADPRRRLRPRVPPVRVHATAAGLHRRRVRRVGVRTGDGEGRGPTAPRSATMPATRSRSRTARSTS